jgi:hypothetical protein
MKYYKITLKLYSFKYDVKNYTILHVWKVQRIAGRPNSGKYTANMTVGLIPSDSSESDSVRCGSRLIMIGTCITFSGFPCCLRILLPCLPVFQCLYLIRQNQLVAITNTGACVGLARMHFSICSNCTLCPSVFFLSSVPGQGKPGKARYQAFPMLRCCPAWE